MALAGLGAELLAELRKPLLAAAVGEDALDPGKRLADRGDLAASLPAAADHAERGRTLTREMLRGDAAGGTRAQLPELVGLDHRGDLGALGVEEHDHERRPALEPRIRLEPREPEL